MRSLTVRSPCHGVEPPVWRHTEQWCEAGCDKVTCDDSPHHDDSDDSPRAHDAGCVDCVDATAHVTHNTWYSHPWEPRQVNGCCSVPRMNILRFRDSHLSSHINRQMNTDSDFTRARHNLKMILICSTILLTGCITVSDQMSDVLCRPNLRCHEISPWRGERAGAVINM